MQTRKTTREDAWNIDGWAETVYKTGKKEKIIIIFIWKGDKVKEQQIIKKIRYR